MIVDKVVDLLAGKRKRFHLVDREVDAALEQHADTRTDELYNADCIREDSTWEDVKTNINSGPGTLITERGPQDFCRGIGRFTENPVIGKGQVYSLEDEDYTIFYIEPFDQTSEVHSYQDVCYIGSPYIVGETLTLQDSEGSQSNYTFAELRDPNETLEDPLEVAEEKKGQIEALNSALPQ